MIIELTTKEHSDYVDDKVKFEAWGEWIEINHNGTVFTIRKKELRKVLTVLCEED
ncbi:hypothetical protein [Cytobacillus massiliigabonensis]|uniref:hypothetical protein n=1 Tax=Cytobacillus massiliigabonensis TaxID=1871011 RepID=UPI0015E0C5A4|nr:hypothetical protein [Cytobacillus massiliigabonensis]